MMVEKYNKIEPSPEISELYPYLTDEELIEAERNLEAYLEVVLRIYNRISDPEAYEKLKEELIAGKNQGGK